MFTGRVLRLGRTASLGLGIVLIALGMSSCGGGGTSVQTNPAPNLLSIVPAAATAGQAGFTDLSAQRLCCGTVALAAH